jgi:hypothetical protein
MFILDNITKFHKLSSDKQFEKVLLLQARRRELKIENRKKKVKSKRTKKVKQTKEEKMLAMLSPELRDIFMKGK